MTVIVDYGASNLESLKNAILFLKKKIKIVNSPQELKKSTRMILPGVGHFSQAVCQLKKKGLFDLLKLKIKEGTPFLGICLGMHLLFEASSEAAGCKGLGVLGGRVLKFKKKGLIVPHMGWNQVKKDFNLSGNQSLKERNLFKGIKDNSYFYFAHSYHCLPYPEQLNLFFTFYGEKFVSAFNKENIWALQFHPERSQANGLRILSNFLNF